MRSIKSVGRIRLSRRIVHVHTDTPVKFRNKFPGGSLDPVKGQLPCMPPDLTDTPELPQDRIGRLFWFG
jgi:hypothetical protein